jgi:hypothetical protein
MRSSSGLLWFGLCEDAQEMGERARYASRVDVVFIDRDNSAPLLDGRKAAHQRDSESLGS